MKKLILLLSIMTLFMSFSCSTDSVEENCECGIVIFKEYDTRRVDIVNNCTKDTIHKVLVENHFNTIVIGKEYCTYQNW